MGRKISQQRIQGVGGVVQCHGEEREEATGDRAAGKREDLGESGMFKWKDEVWVSILISSQ